MIIKENFDIGNIEDTKLIGSKHAVQGLINEQWLNIKTMIGIDSIPTTEKIRDINKVLNNILNLEQEIEKLNSKMSFGKKIKTLKQKLSDELQGDDSKILQSILLVHPDLSLHGFCGEDSEIKYMLSPQNIEVFQQCCRWIKDNIISQKLQRDQYGKQISCYALKHIIEQKIKTYVPNGICIAAILHLKMKCIFFPGGPNIDVMLPEDIIHKLQETKAI
jgi:hypothetical protein